MFFSESSAIVLFVLILGYHGFALGQKNQNMTGSCGRPGPAENAELESEYRNKERFGNDEIVKYRCKLGYTIEGRSRERKCSNGQWSSIKFTCSHITCSYVPSPDNGRRLDSNNRAGDYTEFECDIGYKLKGYSKLICRTDGEWLPSRPPKCDPILCPQLPGVRNGRIFQENIDGVRNDYKSVTEYTCDSGYYLNGETKIRVYERKCQADGTWSGKQPICDVPRCENIALNYQNGTVAYFGDRKLWSHAFYKCDAMHSLFPTGIENSECTKSLKWEPDPPECKEMKRKVIPDNGYDSPRAKNVLHHLDSYTVRCHKDYELYNYRYLERDSLRITNFDGTFTPKVPECVEERCSFEVSGATCFWQGDKDSCKRYDFKVPSPSTVNMKCKDGYKLYKSEDGTSVEIKGHASIVCRKGSYAKNYKCIPDSIIGILKQFTSNAKENIYSLAETIDRFTCRYFYHITTPCKDPCIVPEIPYGFAIYRYNRIVQDVRHGTAVSIGCEKGYTVSKQMSITCRYGEWSRKDVPSCIPNPCMLDIATGTSYWVNSRLLNVETGDTETFKNGTELQTQCKDGYRMKDLNTKTWVQNTRKSLTCVLGMWTKQYACTPEPCVVPTVSHAKLQTHTRYNVKTIEHGKKVTFKCDNGYHFDWSKKKIQFETTCRLGKWESNIPKECKPDPCSQKIAAGTSYLVNSRLLKAKIRDTVTHANGTTLQTQCEDGFRMKDLNTKTWVENIRKSLTCVLGRWTKQYACFPEPCVVPTVSHATVQTSTRSNVKTIEHGKTLTFKCDNGYHFDWSKKVIQFVTKCSFGNWKDSIPKECKPDPCKLKLRVGTSYSVDSNLLTEEDGEKQTFENGTQLLTECKDGYQIQNERSGKYLTHTKRHSTCLTGKWSRLYACYPAPCSVPSVSHAAVSPKGAAKYNHEEKITFSCDPGFHFDQDINTTMKTFETTCNFGSWKDDIPKECYSDGCVLKIMKGSNYYFDEESGNKSEIATTSLMQHTTKIHLQCSEHFNIFNAKNRIFLDTSYMPVVSCYQGKWQNLHFCKERCDISEDFVGKFFKDVEIIIAGESIAHRESVKVKCEDELYDNDPSMECNDGKWKDFVDCSGRTSTSSTTASTRSIESSPTVSGGCELKIMKGSKYYLDEGPDNKSEITTSGLMQHKTKIRLQCSEHFNIFDDKHKIILDTSNMPVVTCCQGKWLNVHVCKERCVISEAFEGKFIKDGESITAGESIAHTESVKVKCENELDENDLSMECNDGKWKNFVDCSGRPTETSPTDSTTLSESSSSEESDSDELTDKKQNERPKGCKLSDDQRFIYNNDDGLEIQPGSTIQNGNTLIVSCATLDLYEYYSTNYDYNDTDETPEHTIACVGDTLTQTELDCPEGTTVTTDSCMKLQHGSVKKENGFFIVSCNKGYSLNLIIPEKPQCSCVNGKLRSKFGNQEPVCKPDDCVVPNEFDERLSVIDKDGVSLSGGSVVKIKDVVNLTCSKAPQPIFEPSNRKFRCMNGLWKEADIDKNWSFGSNGTFPTCREAICNPSCKNGGVCFKDDTCRCSKITKGERCDEVICDEKCLQNGGNCLDPGKCTCPKGRVGTNCEKIGCILPDNAAKYNDSKRTAFSQGEILTAFSCDTGYIAMPRDGMTCRDDGSWSDIVTCEKAVHYLISVKTANGFTDGTDAKVYITLHGHLGRTYKIGLQGTFESDKLDETRVEAVDIRPISSVVVGHDGGGLFPGWYLEYVSIYVENMEEYYVFRKKRAPVWVTGDKDAVLPIEDEHRRCINTFDKGNKWSPRWSVIASAFSDLTNRRPTMSTRGCKQECVNLKNSRCQAVQYNTKTKRCIGITVRDRRYYFERGNWDSPVYVRICKPFN